MTRDVAFVHPDTPLLAAVKLLSARRISGLPVVDDHGDIVGMLTEGDLLRWHDGFREKQGHWLDLLAEGQDLAPMFLNAIRDQNRKVKFAMSPGAETITEEVPARVIAGLMHDKNIKRLPVMRDGKLVGIVTRFDLVRALAEALSETVKQEARPA